MPKAERGRGGLRTARELRDWRVVIALAAVCLQALAVPAQSPLPTPPPPQPGPSDTLPAPKLSGAEPATIDPVLLTKLTRPGDLKLKNSTLSEALFSISEVWKINLVVGQDVKGEVNGVFQGAPLHEILDSILLSNGYSYRPVGQSLVIMPLKDLGDINPLFETATVPVVNNKPEDLLSAVKMLGSPQGKLQAIPSAKSLLVIDFPDRVAMIRAFVQKLDDAAGVAVGANGAGGEGGRLQAAYFAPQYVDAMSLKEALASLLSKEGKVAIMEKDNRVIVTDYPPYLRLSQQAFQQLDRPRPQVRITALIYDLSLEDEERLGINWKLAGKSGNVDASGNAKSQLGIDSVTEAIIPAGTANGTMTFLNLSKNVDLLSVIQALRTCKNSRLLASPSVAAYDNEKSTMSAVTEIPYQQLTQTAQGGNIGTTSFREAGVKLEVIPRIANDGTVKLECSPSFSRLTGYTPGSSPQPIIDRREARTIVQVANKQTLVIGGLRGRTDIKDNSGIPFLKDLPWGVGWLFRSKDTSVRESELVVFLTPEIIMPDEPLHSRDAAAFGTGQCYLDKIVMGEGCPACPPLPGKHPYVEQRFADNCIERRTNLDGHGDGAVIPHPRKDQAGMVEVIEVPPGQPSEPINKPASASAAAGKPAVEKSAAPKPAATAEPPKQAKPAGDKPKEPAGPQLRQPTGFAAKPPAPKAAVAPAWQPPKAQVAQSAPGSSQPLPAMPQRVEVPQSPAPAQLVQRPIWSPGAAVTPPAPSAKAESAAANSTPPPQVATGSPFWSPSANSAAPGKVASRNPAPAPPVASEASGSFYLPSAAGAGNQRIATQPAQPQPAAENRPFWR